jgi:hypothetical protein
MWQAIGWKIVWLIVSYLFKVSRDFIEFTIDAVAKANTLKHDDGTSYTGTEKKDWVLNELVIKYNDHQFMKEWKSTFMAIIELAVSYTKQSMIGEK